MSPKYRGNLEDWLDDENQSLTSNKRPKKAISARSVGIPLDQANAVVCEIFQNQCRIMLDSDGSDLLCNYRRAEVVSKSKTESRERSPVAVGDRVLVSKIDSGGGVIEGVCGRKNALSRPSPGNEGVKFQHVLAANLDALVIVASTEKPRFSPGLVDRFLVAGEEQKLKIFICLTKVDLLVGSGQRPWRIYEELGYDVIEVSVPELMGIEKLMPLLSGQTVAFCGQSGVGKTSLLRVILGKEVGRVATLNLSGKGRHTTTGAILYRGPGHSNWIDTPGVREFGLAHLPPNLLKNYFKEFSTLKCEKTGCMHWDEPQCQARGLYRYPSYRRILHTLLSKKKPI